MGSTYLSLPTNLIGGIPYSAAVPLLFYNKRNFLFSSPISVCYMMMPEIIVRTISTLTNTAQQE